MHTRLAAALSDPTLRPPVRLLYATLYSRTNGTGRAAMNVDDLMDQLGITSDAVLRKYRAELLSAGYAESRLDDGVLYWSLTAPDRRAEDETARPTGALNDDGPRLTGAVARLTGALNDEERAPQARSAENSAPARRADDPKPPQTRLAGAPTRPTGALEGAPVGRLVVNINPPISGTNLPVRTGPGAEADRTYRLLTDPELGIGEPAARRIARQHSFEAVLAHVMTWRHQCERGQITGPGAIVNRIDSRWRCEDLTEADRATELYRRHVPPEEDAANDNAALVRRYAPPTGAGRSDMHPSNAELVRRYGGARVS